MGGVAGHMDHLYDNPDLTFAKMKEILSAASNGELTTEEKVDGQNLFLSYSIPEGRAKGARNKGNLKSGGLDATSLATKFAGRGGLETAFNGGFKAFETAVEALSDSEKRQIFGPDTNVWYNAEIMDPGTPGDTGDPGAVNVIKYDDKTLKIHDVGHFVFDRETGEKEDIDPQSLQALDNAYTRMQNSLKKSDFNLARQAIIQLEKLENDTILNDTIKRIDSAINSEGLSDSNTVEDYMFNRVVNGLGPNLSMGLKKELANYFLQLPSNVGLRAIKKGLPPAAAQEVSDIVKNKTIILRQAVQPLEMAIHDFTVELLKGLKSVFIADNTAEVSRLRKELSIAVKELTKQGPQDPNAMEVVQHHLNKIKDYSNITTPVEAVVFDYDGHTYKFAGNFAPLNQILGMFKYRSPVKKLTSESKSFNVSNLTEKEGGKRIALFPGKFKPPHRGHLDYVNKIAKRSDVDDVLILISPVDHPEVNNDQSLKIWNKYLENAEPNITAKIAEYRSPVQAVYEFVADPKNASEGDTVLLVKSSKDIGDTRFDRAQSYAERTNPGVIVEDIVEDPVESPDGLVYSARHMREAIAKNDKKTFLQYVPPKVDGDMVWSFLTDNKSGLNKFIDDTIEEISTMSSGAVEGPQGTFGFGPPNSHNPWNKRRSSKKPKVRRAKRQRRR